jgi:hypothetical protein
MPTLQLTKLNGSIIENGKWEVKSLSDLDIGHQIQVSVDAEDSDLISYVSKLQNLSCVVDKADDKHSIIATCVVKAFRHMLDPSGLDSMAVIVPINRTVEEVMSYVLNPKQCNPKFVALIKQQN